MMLYCIGENQHPHAYPAFCLYIFFLLNHMHQMAIARGMRALLTVCYIWIHAGHIYIYIYIYIYTGPNFFQSKASSPCTDPKVKSEPSYFSYIVQVQF